MQTQKILKPEGKILVVCDYREKEVARELAVLGARINKTNLDVADFVCSERVAVERKSHSDFVSSIIDGRLFDQAKLMNENYKNPVIIIEGWSDRNINPNALKAAIASLIVDHKISLVNTKNKQDTAKTIYWIAEKEQHKNRKDLGIKVGKKPKDLRALQEMIVAGLPGISTVISKRLLNHFGSVEKIFSASAEELVKVEGVGKKLAARIAEVTKKKYS